MLRTYVEYASWIGTFSGAGGWIPTGGNGARRDHAVVKGIRQEVCLRPSWRGRLRAWKE